MRLEEAQLAVASAGGVPVAGIGERRPGLAPSPVWTPYFSVRDADAAAARIRERGATLAVGPIPLGQGRAGLAADPDGATFGFWESPGLAWVSGEGEVPLLGSICRPETSSTQQSFTARSSTGPRKPAWQFPTGMDMSWSNKAVKSSCPCAGAGRRVLSSPRSGHGGL